MAYAGYGRTAVGAARSLFSALRAASWHPCGCCGAVALVRRFAQGFWSVACGQSCCVCPARPVGLAAARHWPCAGLPIRPPKGGSHSPAPIPHKSKPNIGGGFAPPTTAKIHKFVLHPPLHRTPKKKPRYHFDSGVSLYHLGWLMGLEPTTTGITILDSTN